MTAAKFLLLGVLAGLASSIVGDTAAQIAAVAAGVGGALYLFTKLVAALKRVSRLVDHWLDTVQMLQALPTWIESTNDAAHDVSKRLSALEEKADRTHEPVEALVRDLGIPHREPRR